MDQIRETLSRSRVETAYYVQKTRMRVNFDERIF